MNRYLTGLFCLGVNTLETLIDANCKQITDIYWVSKLGYVVSTYGQPHKLKPYRHGSVWVVKLSYPDGTEEAINVGRLVYRTFKGEIPKDYYIDHINGMKGDNALHNLRLVHRYDVLRKVAGKSKLSPRIKDNKTGIVYDSIAAFARANHWDRSHISRVSSGKSPMPAELDIERLEGKYGCQN